MKRLIGFIALMMFTLMACKKAEERSCWKSYGEMAELEIPLDSVNSFQLYKNLKYRFFQDDSRKIVVKGGSNVIGKVEVMTDNYVTTVKNTNSCNFLRDSDKKIEVEIHYPHFKDIHVEPSDSVIFEETITGDSLFFEMRNGGGSAVLDVDLNFLRINVSHGAGDYKLSGSANRAEVKIQNNGFADASHFNAASLFLFQNSTADLYINLVGSSVLLKLEGTGDVYYSGNYFLLSREGNGSGEFIKL